MIRANTTRRPTVFALLVVGLFAVLGFDCSKVDDTVSANVDGTPTATTVRGDCVVDCRDEFKEARAAEFERHAEALAACKGDTQCEEEAEDLFFANLFAIEAALHECIASCHDQGGGSGGN